MCAAAQSEKAAKIQIPPTEQPCWIEDDNFLIVISTEYAILVRIQIRISRRFHCDVAA
jgi:hypothetical protein